MATVPLDVPGPSDAELIESVRGGDTSAYGSLYERHVGAAYNLARQLTRSTTEVDDLVAEAFAKVLDTLRDGRGPDTAFRAYLLTALRHTAYDKTRRDRKLELAEDVTTVASPEAISVQFSDTAVSGLERSLAAKAFARLSERWQVVLWHTEIEGQTPAEVAPLLGLTANGVSALAYRAREGLRQAYLQVHLAESNENRCRATVDRLGAWTRGGLSKRETAQVETHLDECERCRALATELADVNGALRALVAPLVLGAGAIGYLATIGAGSAKAATVTVAAGASASAGGAASLAGAVPRQVIGVGSSAATLAVAIAIALTSGQSKPVTAAAAPPPPPPPATAAPPSPKPPAPPQPPPPAKPPAPPQPPASPAPPPAPPPAQTPAPPAPPPPPVTKASLAPTVPSAPINLVPGGPGTAFPVTVANDGNGTSEPVTTTLNLPDGVTAALSGPQSMAPQRLLGSSNPINCTGGTGSISCTTAHGLAAGESVTFTFELTASQNATGGQITGSITAGDSVRITLSSVTVRVRQVDDLELTAHLWRPGFFWAPRIDVTATNRSTHDGTATFTVNAPTDGVVFTSAPCHQDGEQINCEFDLVRGESIQFGVWVSRWFHRDDVVRVAGSLGSSRKVIDVPVNCDPGSTPGPSPSPIPGTPVTPTTPPAPTPPVTTTPTPTPTSEPPTGRSGRLCPPLLDRRWPLCRGTAQTTSIGH